jgi:hypothetical protein
MDSGVQIDSANTPLNQSHLSSTLLKILVLVMFGLLLVSVSVYSGIQIGKKQALEGVFTTQQTISGTSPRSAQSVNCYSDTDCPTNTFCDYNTPGGMGPNGMVTGNTSGSQQCITRCSQNQDCPSHVCMKYYIVTGDIINKFNGCQPE